MPIEKNSAQVEFWNGHAGERWARHQVSLDRALGAFGHEAQRILAPRPGEHILDIGCGAGQTTLELAAAVGPKGSVVGVDISGPMLEIARLRAKGQSNIEFVLDDACAFKPPRLFDACFSRFGIMFFEDPASAFVHLHSLLVPRGRLAFVCWQTLEENEWLSVPAQALRAFEPTDSSPSAPHAPGPFAFADRKRLTDLLNQGGFERITIEPFGTDVVFSENGLTEAAEFATRVGPAGRWLTDLDAGQRQRAKSVLMDALLPHSVGDRVTLSGRADCVVAFSRA